ncbi:hypothetical protein [Aquisediminimonas sediminicola]|uniref:hypothetical protein n=1 Tax=Alteraquisediminimonas sediminicola TaxID=2676787 RepID=UPI001C8D2EBC|nr:hypothetical protein [Aquisediminimonas sediminicola]
MRSESKWWRAPEALALLSLTLAPIAPAMAQMPNIMMVTICTGGETRMMAIKLHRDPAEKSDDCPRVCHAICDRKRHDGCDEE